MNIAREVINYTNTYKQCSQCPHHVDNHQGRGYRVKRLCGHDSVTTRHPPIPSTGEITVDAPEVETYPLIPNWCPLLENKER